MKSIKFKMEKMLYLILNIGKKSFINREVLDNQ